MDKHKEDLIEFLTDIALIRGNHYKDWAGQLVKRSKDVEGTWYYYPPGYEGFEVKGNHHELMAADDIITQESINPAETEPTSTTEALGQVRKRSTSTQREKSRCRKTRG